MNKKLIGYALTIALSLSGGAAIADTYIPRAATYGYHLLTFTRAAVTATANIYADPSPNAFFNSITTSDGYSTAAIGFNNGSTYSNATYNGNDVCTGTCYTAGGQANTNLFYYVTVVAPNSATIFDVPIYIDGTATVSTSYQASTEAAIGIDGIQGNNNGRDFVCNSGVAYASSITCGANIFSINGSTTAYTPDELATPLFSSSYSFSVGLLTRETIASPYAASATASVNSYVYIDPTFAAANPGYSLMFSAGIDNVAPVPLPASAWLLLSSIGGLGVFARKRKA